MNRLLLTITFCVSALFLQAQDLKKNIRTKVLVLGDEQVAVGAAVQAAVSGVSTTLITTRTDFSVSPLMVLKNIGLPQGEFNSARIQKSVPDPGTGKKKAAPPQYNPEEGDSILNFTGIKNKTWSKLERSGGGWSLKLSDGRTVRADVLIYTLKADLSEKVKYASNKVYTPLTYENNLFRTTLAANNVGYMSLYTIQREGEDNLLIVNGDDADLAAGKGAGVAAAYATYFGRKISEVNLKIGQGELLKFRSGIMPFADVKLTDTAWSAMQKVGATGVLKAELRNGSAYFMPDKEVTYAEIKQPIKDYYYKAQLWFDDHAETPVTLEKTIALVSYVGNKSPETTTREIEKKWKTGYKFTSAFDLKKVLTRREFSSIVTDYMNPFSVNVDRTGKVIR